MKYCPHCGKELSDDASFCSGCGKNLNSSSSFPSNQTTSNEMAGRASGDGLGTATKVFLILALVSTVISAIMTFAGASIGGEFLIYIFGEDVTGEVNQELLKTMAIISGIASLIPLAWMIPMSISIWHKIDRREPIGTGMKVCTLLFVSLIGGILLLCRNDQNNY